MEVVASVSDALDQLDGVVDALGEAIGIKTIKCTEHVLPSFAAWSSKHWIWVFMQRIVMCVQEETNPLGKACTALQDKGVGTKFWTKRSTPDSS